MTPTSTLNLTDFDAFINECFPDTVGAGNASYAKDTFIIASKALKHAADVINGTVRADKNAFETAKDYATAAVQHTLSDAAFSADARASAKLTARYVALFAEYIVAKVVGDISPDDCFAKGEATLADNTLVAVAATEKDRDRALTRAVRARDCANASRKAAAKAKTRRLEAANYINNTVYRIADPAVSANTVRTTHDALAASAVIVGYTNFVAVADALTKDRRSYTSYDHITRANMTVVFAAADDTLDAANATAATAATAALKAANERPSLLHGDDAAVFSIADLRTLTANGADLYAKAVITHLTARAKADNDKRYAAIADKFAINVRGLDILFNTWQSQRT
ncbi:hypothetical protein AGMMS50222_04830 [Endomicrobiia bacterium]|nr:hypothetical protein AGMMS49556_00630 [Endomicrobiia bacterium]GHT74885.1 hypothetical protein AGMMS50222_04830 [Endomicrobiia bacterium]